jgi:epoxyqueuosine reductase
MNSQTIKLLAQECGFALCGIAKAEPLIIEKEWFEKALAQNFHDGKPYLERDVEKRFQPGLLLEGCKSVVVCGFNYFTGEKEKGEKEDNKIARYAQIEDYHIFMKEKLEMFAQRLQEQYGTFHYKTTVDTSPISEKAWAVRAGIGYYGKNGIIQTSFGSFIFLGILLIDKEVDEYDDPNRKTCGNCSKCITACPTHAIVNPYYVDCTQCISHINLNKKETDFWRIAQYGWIKGCDVCQEACPNNLHAPVNAEAVAIKKNIFLRP